MKSSRDQAVSLLQQHGLPATHLDALHGWSNDVWLTQTHVVRLSSGRFRQSFHHEVNVIQLIGDRLPVPDIIAHGEADGKEWMIAERVRGRNLLDASNPEVIRRSSILAIYPRSGEIAGMVLYKKSGVFLRQISYR